MEISKNRVKNHYNSNVMGEWLRLERHPFEFALTLKKMEKYIKTGDSILDIGGGPGRYSIYFAKKGCNVTLFDLSEENITFAKQMAKEYKVKIKAICGDVKEIGKIVKGEFDHVFLMGPLYHLLEESDRIQAVTDSLSLLKNKGNLYVSFIAMVAGMIYFLKSAPQDIIMEREEKFIDCFLKDKSYSGEAFTLTHFARQGDILPFFDRFPLKKLNLFGQEGILALCEEQIKAQSKEVMDRWIELAYDLCEREELLSHSEHLMYIGQKV